MPNSIVTIDGPSASGKSTVAKAVAAHLGSIYVDSGAFYRGITWQALKEGIDTRDSAAVIRALARMDIRLRVEDNAVRMTIGGADPGLAIRSEAVSESVSDVAKIPEVREAVNGHLRRTAQFGSIVMEGRDIGSVVFPGADFKFYLEASPAERARRRHAELVQRKEDVGMDRVLGSLKRRDAKDSGRQTAPLTIPAGAAVIDTTGLDIGQVTERVLEAIRPKG